VKALGSGFRRNDARTLPGAGHARMHFGRPARHSPPRPVFLCAHFRPAVV